jgi:hypothetical protein
MLEALSLEQKEIIENYQVRKFNNFSETLELCILSQVKLTLLLTQEKERAFETERRRLHNTILELKGNIRVFCRIR